MPSKSRSIWRSDKAQHFTLVHRSQQDPLVYDAESSSRVLKPTARKNQQRQGQSREELEQELGDYAKKQRSNVGEAAQYGIFYDDTEYDYMQHLRAVGDDYHRRRGGVDEENDTEVIMLEAPKATRVKDKGKTRELDTGVQLRDDSIADDRIERKRKLLQLPKEVLPSEQMMSRNFEEERERGLRPDMDPHLRQVLEALEDDAFLMRTAGENHEKDPTEVDDFDFDEKDEVEAGGEDEEDIDDFFSGIVKDGELDEADEEPEWKQLPPEGEENIWEDQGFKAAKELLQLKQQGGGVDDLSLESRVALFKQAQQEQQQKMMEKGDDTKQRVASSVGSQSIFGEKGPSRKSRHPGAKARLAASYYAPSVDGGSTAFSMSSSAMERNQGLTGLDDRFDQMEKIYEQDSDEEEDEEKLEGEQFDLKNLDAIFDDFLNNNELVGNKLRGRLGNHETTASEKVDMLRRELGEVRLVDKVSIDEVDDQRESYDEVIFRDLKSRAQIRQEWDVETVLTSKTNLENHPRTIASVTSHLPRSVTADSSLALFTKNGSQGDNRVPRVRINPRTGVPEISHCIDLEARENRQAEMVNNKDGDNNSAEEDNDSDDSRGAESDSTQTPQNITVTRNRNESKEDKKMRKQIVKDQKRQVRQSKQARKQVFEAELNKQKKNTGGGSAIKQATALKLS